MPKQTQTLEELKSERSQAWEKYVLCLREGTTQQIREASSAHDEVVQRYNDVLRTTLRRNRKGQNNGE